MTASKMRLNKFQYAWIKKLKSGTTKKAKGVLKRGGRQCCLAVGICVVGERFTPKEKIDLDPEHYPLTSEALGLNGPEGPIDLNKVSDKWKKEMENSKMSIENIKCPLLTSLNDYTSWSHVKIGQFIDENRSAVFKASNR